jgi:hypothetical protein
VALRAHRPAYSYAQAPNRQRDRPMRNLRRIILIFVLVCVGAFAAEMRPRSVVLVTMDGSRRQEVFRGAEERKVGAVAEHRNTYLAFL